MMFITGVTLFVQLSAHALASIPTAELAACTEAILPACSGIGPTLITMRVGGDTPAQTDAGVSRTRSRSHALSHLTFRRTIRGNDTLDISADGFSSHGDSPLNSSIGREDHGGHNEKI
ncbi:hypothetical protein D9619_005129 [Psilocybe cf. subviscida]|uniref:Uncharacterized protein n=1 Tax=Psilocybe cf. subviscida TaxID=2480587 RepID=A0A8H5BP34_9AGAR|nr:hypothetical protein D9619_005129 [Psilocybe cf. subviscida]